MSRIRLSLVALALLAALGAFLSFRPAERPARRDDPPALRGTVRDERGPVAGARVRLKGTADSVRTDDKGRFLLPGRSPGPGRVTAWADGYLIAGAPSDRLPLDLTLTRLPEQDNEEYEWVDPAPDPAGRHNCANCHDKIYREWSQSAHSRSATGNRFRSFYETLFADNPDASGVCTACHAPSVPSSDPGYFDLREVRGVPAKGVHCDYCHKIADAPTEGLGKTHGRFGLTLLRPAEGQLFFGPLDDVDRGEDAYSPLYRESRYCASCHEGIVLGVHVYSTFSEWKQSPAGRAGKHCQACHTAPTGAMTNIAPGKGGIERDPATLGNHRFFAGSQLDMLRRCLKVTLTAARNGDAVRAEAEVRAGDVGHRVPTGFIDRHLLLVVEAFATDGTRLAPSAGPTLPAAAGKGLAGRAGRLYGRVTKDFEGRGPVPFWKAAPEVTDTRLSPGQPDREAWSFPATAVTLRGRLVYRRFWQEVADGKGWADNELVVVDQTVTVK